MRSCPRCQRTNPDEAAFCYFDGFDLRQVAVNADGSTVPLALPVEMGPPRLPHEFVFPTGRRCFSYDDLVQGCMDDWPSARDMLVQGAFRQYLTGAGRLDLARAADEALRQHPDADLALDAFVGRLPAMRLPKPELELQPHKLLLDPIRTGATRPESLVVLNVGTGLLHGNLSVVDGGGWLRLMDATGPSRALKVTRQQTVHLEVDTRGLPAPQKCAARLTVITNGGIVEVPVRLDVTALPFRHPPYEGASTPRELAVRMRDHPKPAVALFENGEIGRWFEANCWAYPVVGPTAPKMAAVQQFFECLGLAKAPRVQLNETEVRFCCLRGETVRGQVELTTTDRKWIYAHAASEAPWLRVMTPAASGPQRAVVEFEVDSQSLTGNRVHETTLRLAANAGQPLALRVAVDVRRPVMPAQRRWLRPIIMGAALGLLLRLLLAGAEAIAGHESPFGAVFVRSFVAATWWLGALLGGLLVVRRGRWWDLPFGLIAGAGAGIAAAGTLACLLPLLDSWPRAAGQLLTASGGPAVWLFLTIMCWTLVGAAGGMVLGLARTSGDARD